MARLLFRLANVPESEAEDIRQLLEENQILFYQTEAGRWQLGVDAIWVTDEDTYVAARELINQYQQGLQRDINEQIENQQYQSLGFWQGIYYGFKERPGAMLITVISILIVLMFVLMPFFSVF